LETPAYSPTQNIFTGSWRRPKTLFGFAVVDAGLATISDDPICQAII